jgi:hypothetical protein
MKLGLVQVWSASDDWLGLGRVVLGFARVRGAVGAPSLGVYLRISSPLVRG